jgi:hypothetical protein
LHGFIHLADEYQSVIIKGYLIYYCTIQSNFTYKGNKNKCKPTNRRQRRKTSIGEQDVKKRGKEGIKDGVRRRSDGQRRG